MLWAFAAGAVPMGTWADSPARPGPIALVVPFVHHVHFHLVHRLPPLPALYRRIPAWRHRAVNPQPWSPLSVHPVDLALSFSGAGLHLLVGSHPLPAIHHLHDRGPGAAIGHIGFGTIGIDDDHGFDTQAFTRYLHHRYCEVNDGEGLVPIDRWVGSRRDSSAAAQARIEVRRRRTKDDR